jgi:hypothetical protein
MIDTNLMKQARPLDREVHRARRLNRSPDDLKRCAGSVNAVFVAMAEFVDVCREFPIVFVPAGTRPDGGIELAPMAVLGLTQGENLMFDADGKWTARYVPAALRTYPFALGAMDAQQLVLCIDDSYTGWSDSDGQPLFLERFESDVQRTRALCQRLTQLELLRTMRFDATLPDGNKLGVDGFYALDEEKFSALPDATVIELHKNGMLGLLHAHHISLGHMRHMVERRLAQRAQV